MKILKRLLKMQEDPIAYYFLLIGTGLAYGLFGNGFVFVWYLEAVLVAAIASGFPIGWNRWMYRTYLIEVRKVAVKPFAAIFFGVQLLVNSLVIFTPAVVVIGVKSLLGIDHINGHVYVVGIDAVSGRMACTKFKDSPDTLLREMNRDHGPGCELKVHQDRHLITCGDLNRMVFFSSPSNCSKFIGG